MPDTTDTLEQTAVWFERAIPAPTSKNVHTQLGVHFEEVAEMIAALKGEDRQTQAMLTHAMIALHGLALHLKSGDRQITAPDRLELLDALCDQIVTATGVGHMLGCNVPAAMREVNRSNWSKFVDGQPVFDANGKIQKGSDYSPPWLAPYIKI